jgi:hypothetical protein
VTTWRYVRSVSRCSACDRIDERDSVCLSAPYLVAATVAGVVAAGVTMLRGYCSWALLLLFPVEVLAVFFAGLVFTMVWWMTNALARRDPDRCRHCRAILILCGNVMTISARPSRSDALLLSMFAVLNVLTLMFWRS